MLEWIIGLLVAKWWADKQEKKEPEFTGNIDANSIPYGYVKSGETIKDLQ